PDHLSMNKDLWEKITPIEIRKSAERFLDMLVKRQASFGGFPMGYLENTHGYYLADGGQMALSLAQSTRYIKNEEKRKSYLNACYKYAEWAESLYIDSAKSDSLKIVKPEDYQKG